MHPRTQEILDYLDSQHAALEDILAGVPTSALDERPSEGRWSVAEIVEHLAIVENRVLQVLEAQLDPRQAVALPAETETSSVMSLLDLSRLQDRSRPLVASEGSQPRGGMPTGEAWALLTERRRQVREKVIAADGLALGTVSVPHPRLGPLNLLQWLLFLGAHEARHAAQIREVVALTDAAD